MTFHQCIAEVRHYVAKGSSLKGFGGNKDTNSAKVKDLFNKPQCKIAVLMSLLLFGDLERMTIDKRLR